MILINFLLHYQISRLEHVHSKSFVHRDLKAENFVMGIGRRGNLVYLIDFGLAKKYRNSETHRHVQPKKRLQGLTGTARYVSVNTHLGLGERTQLDS